MHNYIHFETITTHSRKSLSLNCHKDIILGFTLFSPFGAESLHAHEYCIIFIHEQIYMRVYNLNTDTYKNILCILNSNAWQFDHHLWIAYYLDCFYSYKFWGLWGLCLKHCLQCLLLSTCKHTIPCFFLSLSFMMCLFKAWYIVFVIFGLSINAPGMAMYFYL